MMLQLPRLSTNDAPHFTQIWDQLCTSLEDHINGAAQSSALNAAFGSGRLVSADESAGAPAMPPSPSLAIKLPNALYLIQGQLIEIDDPAGYMVLTGVPASKPQGVYGYLSLSDTGVPEITSEHWFDTPQNTLDLACIGLIKSDADSVTDVDADPADVILLNRLLRQRQEQLEARIALLEAGGSGESGGAYYANLLPWQPTPGDSRDSVTVVLELLAEQEAELRAEIASGGRRPRATRLDHLVHETAIIRQEITALKPDGGERSQSANVLKTVDGLYGTGANGYPDHIDTQLTISEDGSLEP